MRLPQISVGIPVYQGTEYVLETINAVQQQTWSDLEILISIDGGDRSSAEVCRSILDDQRVTITERNARLDWSGNINWLMQHAAGDYFCYIQQDDLIDPEYCSKLRAAIRASPGAVAAYADLQWFGDHQGIVRETPLVGTPAQRFSTHVEQLGWIPLRALVSTDAIRKIGPLRKTEFRSCLEEFVWLSKLCMQGDIVRVPEVLYAKRYHPGSIHGHFHRWPEERRLNCWVTCFSGLVEAISQGIADLEERHLLFCRVLDRFLNHKNGRWMFFETDSLSAQQKRDMVQHLVTRLQAERRVDLKELLGSAWLEQIEAELARLGMQGGCSIATPEAESRHGKPA